MITQIGAIWTSDSGGATVGQATARTRVAVVTFDRTATVVAELDKIRSNDELITILNSIKQTDVPGVDGLRYGN